MLQGEKFDPSGDYVRRWIPELASLPADVIHRPWTAKQPLPPESPFWELAQRVEAPLNEALGRLDPAPVDLPFPLNDLVVQRYATGSSGITPHRDHVRYLGLVANLVLSGDARFSVCRDRSGHDARDVAGLAGHIILMRNIGFAGLTDRPFHAVSDIKERRVIVGLRYRKEA